MGNNFTKEHSSTWKQDDVREWKKKAFDMLKFYYLAFSGSQFDAYDPGKNLPLLRAKICYAVFGPPENDASKIEDAYSDNQRNEAQKIVDVIVKVHQSTGLTELSVGIIFIYCKQGEKEYPIPVFRVYTGKNKLSKYVDTQCRTYNSWNDWKKNNRLPMMKYCYPINGYFSCTDNCCKFDASLDPVVEYGNSPACDPLSRAARITDVTAGIGGFGAGVLGIAALFTPAGLIAAPILMGSSIVVSASATYGLGRAIDRLVDKGRHGESLSDFESATLWISIAATPLHFVSSVANAKLAAGAAQGRIFSTSTRMFATLLNCTTLGVDGVMLGFGLANLIEKYNKDQLSSLDVLQFSMSVFFFSHTLMQPITAKAVIQKAQNQYIEQYGNNMQDADTQAAFKNFLDRNRGDMTADSKVIRSLNNMDDPNAFFKGVGEQATVDIGGRKGKTVLVTDTNGQTNRINPNRTFFETKTQNPVTLKNVQKLQNCLGKPLEEYVLNGNKIFENLSDRQKGRIGKVFGNTAGYNKEIIHTAEIIAKSLGINDADNFMSVVEIVAADVKGKTGTELTNQLGHIQSAGKDSFVQGIKNDVAKASQIAENADLTFTHPYTAAYHYRKHGADFTSKIQGNSIEFYLGTVPEKIIYDANLTNICTFNDGTVQKTYITPSNQLAVIIETPSKQTISTMFQKNGIWESHVAKMEQLRNNTVHILPINDSAALLASSLGFRQMHIYLTTKGEKMPLSEIKNLDTGIHEQIAKFLTKFSAHDNDN